MRRISPGLSLAEVLALLNATLERGEAGLVVDRLASLEGADQSSIAVLSQGRFKTEAARSSAAAVVTNKELAPAVSAAAALILVEDAYWAYGVLARQFDRLLQPRRVTGIDPNATVAESARIHSGASAGAGAVISAHAEIGENVSIGAGCIVGEAAVIRAGSIVHPGVIIGADTEIGADCIIHSGTVIGSDGFGFARKQGRWEKIPQLGRVVIGADVEIGANCSIDRGALDDTVIGDGCKLDNLIQIAHNVRIGEHTAIAACVGIAGSARIGRRCMIGGAAGILGHLEICDDVTISAMSLVTRSITKPGVYSGIFPLMDNANWERAAVLLRKLPDIRSRLLALESQMKES